MTWMDDPVTTDSERLADCWRDIHMWSRYRRGQFAAAEKRERIARRLREIRERSWYRPGDGKTWFLCNGWCSNCDHYGRITP